MTTVFSQGGFLGSVLVRTVKIIVVILFIVIIVVIVVRIVSSNDRNNCGGARLCCCQGSEPDRICELSAAAPTAPSNTGKSSCCRP